MPGILSNADVEIDLGTRTQRATTLTSDYPFRAVLLGDFGGRASRNEPRLRRDPIAVTAENFEGVMELLGAGLKLSAGGVDLQLAFREMDDFHPDRLYYALPVFDSLRQARAELLNPATFRAAAASPGPTPPPAPPPSGSLLDWIVDESATPPPPEPAADRAAAVDDAIRRIVEPHIVPKPDVRQTEALAQVDRAASALMRAILTHPHFQALEAAWRSVFYLLQRMRTGTEVKLSLIDITREEILEAARAGLPQLIARDGWSAAACLHSFQPAEADFDALACLATVAHKCGGSVFAGMHPRLLGCPSLAAAPDPDDWEQPPSAVLDGWRQIRGHADARWLGLAMPRLLLRLPYGRDTSPADTFDFEEMPQAPDHEAYLWGSPAVGCVCLLGQAFRARGWNMQPGDRSQLDGLPVHNYHTDGEPRMTPAAETWLTGRATDRMLAAGLIPLASSTITDAVRLVSWQSIADPPAPLAGPWD